MRRFIRAACAAVGLISLTQAAHAQALGPQRQFLAIEPYYESTTFDLGQGVAKEAVNGYGGRLWINLDPFHFIPNGSIALYTSYAPSQGNATAAFNGITTLHYGAEYDQYFVRRPLGGIIDPFLTVGGGRIRFNDRGAKDSYWTLTPGGGLRLPFPNRFEVRADVKDLMIFNTPSGTAGAKRTTHNLLLQAGLGLTF